jgi:hypothetical protein
MICYSNSLKYKTERVRPQFLSSASHPSRDILFPLLISGRKPAERGLLRPLSEPRAAAARPISGLFLSLSAHFLRPNRTTAILVRMLKTKSFNLLHDTRRGAGLKNLRSGGVNRDRTVRFSVPARASCRPLSPQQRTRRSAGQRARVDPKRPFFILALREGRGDRTQAAGPELAWRQAWGQ